MRADAELQELFAENVLAKVWPVANRDLNINVRNLYLPTVPS